MANNITEKNVLKGWFKKGLKPLEAQFHAWMDSYWHKNEEIPIKNIENLEDTLNNKAETQNLESISRDLKNHSEDTGLHKTIEEQAKLDNLADDPNSTYATKTDLQIIEDNPDYLVFPLDFRKTRKEMKAVCKEYYDSICAREISVDRPIYFKFFWYDDPANPETSTFSTFITPCSENPEINSDNPFSILQAVANLPVKIITPEEIENDPDVVGSGRTVVLLAFSSTDGNICNLSISTYIPVNRYNFNLLFIPKGFLAFESQDFIKNHAGKTFTGELQEDQYASLSMPDKWNDLYKFIQKYNKAHQARFPSVCLRGISSDIKEIYKPAIVELYSKGIGMFKGLKLRTCSIEQVDGIDYFIEEILDIPTFTGIGSQYLYKLTATPCKPQIYTVSEYPTDVSNYPDGTIFIKQAL